MISFSSCSCQCVLKPLSLRNLSRDMALIAGEDEGVYRQMTSASLHIAPGTPSSLFTRRRRCLSSPRLSCPQTSAGKQVAPNTGPYVARNLISAFSLARTSACRRSRNSAQSGCCVGCDQSSRAWLSATRVVHVCHFFAATF